MAELAFKVDIDSKGFASITKLSGDFTKLDKNAKKSGDSMAAFGKQMAAIAAIGALAKLGKDAIFAAAELESLELQFKPLLGSAEEAKKRIGELSKFAASTPFELPAIAKASKTLQTLTGGMLATGDGLKLVGDAAAVAGVGFDELSIHVGRAFSNLKANRAAGESISRLQELGLVSGQTRNEIEELQKAGRGEEAWLLLQENLKKTEGAMEGLSNTFNGKMSTLSDNWRLFTADFAEKSGVFDLAKNSVNALIKTMDFLTNKELNAKFEENMDQFPELKKLLEDQERQKDEAFKKEQKRIADESKARSDAIKNQKINFANAKKLRKQEEDAEIKAMETSLKLEEEAIAKRDKLAVDNIIAMLDMEEQLRQENRLRKVGEFEFAREQEIAEYELKKQMFVGFNDALLLAKEEHTAKMLEIDKKQAISVAQLEKKKQEAQLDTFNVGAQIAQNTLATMGILFGKNKMMASAMVTIQGAQAVINAMATTPWPLNLSTAVLIGAQTASSLKQINSTKAFALGGVIGGGEQHIRVNEQGEESIINAPATRALGRETIDLLNNGRADLLGKNSGGDTYNFNATGYISDDMLDQFEAMVASRRGNR